MWLDEVPHVSDAAHFLLYRLGVFLILAYQKNTYICAPKNKGPKGNDRFFIEKKLRK